MFSLAHISDVHLAPLPSMRRRDLMSKRITGYMNWTRNRAKEHGHDTLSVLMADLLSHNPDHIAITGDLVNLALGAEFAATRDWLRSLGSSDLVSVVPGNHDAYVPGALLNAYRAWGDYMPIDVAVPATADTVERAFPYVRKVGPIAIAGVSSAVASAPFLATGRFRNDQARRLHALLLEAKKDGLFRVVLIHHPPFRYDGDVAKRLYGIRLFQHTVLEAGAEMILHGHTHVPSVQFIGKGYQAIPVVGVPSASQSPDGHKPAARWNEYKISGGPGRWNCQWTERAIQHDTTVAQVGTRQLWCDGQSCRESVPKT